MSEERSIDEPPVETFGRWFRRWPTSRPLRIWAQRDKDGWRPYVELVPARDLRLPDDAPSPTFVYASEHAFATMTGAIWHATQCWSYGE